MTNYLNYKIEEFFSTEIETIIDFIKESRKNSINRIGEEWRNGVVKLHRYEKELNEIINLIYEDTFYGREKFAGNELLSLEIKYKNKEALIPIWFFNIQGRLNETASYFESVGLQDKEERKKRVFNFLKEALINEEKYDFRGPKKFKKGNFSLINKIEDENDWWDFFSGEIKIKYAQDQELYKEIYSGNLINTKDYRIKDFLFN